MESQLAVWETPEFDEIGVAPEVTMYIARWRTSRTCGRRGPVGSGALRSTGRAREPGCGCAFWARRREAVPRSGTAAARCAPPSARGRSAPHPVVGRGELDRSRWFLINASPDVRTQIEALPGLRPLDARTTPLESVLLTDAELDHTLGLLLLREARRACAPRHAGGAQDAVRGLGSAAHARALLPRQVAGVVPGTDVLLGAGLPTGPSTSPPRSTTASGRRTAEGRVVGYRLTDERTGGRRCTCRECSSSPPPCSPRSRTAPASYRRHLLARRRADPARPGRQDVPGDGPPALSGSGGSLEQLPSLRVRRTIYIHMNNTNPILLEDSPERRTGRSRAGWRWPGTASRSRSQHDDDDVTRQGRVGGKGTAEVHHFVEPLRGYSRRYHGQHPFHLRMNEGQLQPRQIRGWAAEPLLLPGEHPAQGRGDPRQLPRPRGAPPLDPPDHRPRRHRAGEGGIEAWLRLGEAAGLTREELLRPPAPRPRGAFRRRRLRQLRRTRPWVEAVASSLTELFAPDLMARAAGRVRAALPVDRP